MNTILNAYSMGTALVGPVLAARLWWVKRQTRPHECPLPKTYKYRKGSRLICECGKGYELTTEQAYDYEEGYYERKEWTLQPKGSIASNIAALERELGIGQEMLPAGTDVRHVPVPRNPSRG